jgi:hypothetical protein
MKFELIMLDKIDWPGIIGPQYIINFIDNIFDINHLDIIKVYTGINPYYDSDIGIWVKQKDYNRINYSLSFVFLHFDCCDNIKLFNYIKENGYDTFFEKVEDKKLLKRAHVHITFSSALQG